MQKLMGFLVFGLGVMLSGVAPGVSVAKSFFADGFEWPLWIALFLLPILGVVVTFIGMNITHASRPRPYGLWIFMEVILALLAFPLMVGTGGLFIWSLCIGAVTFGQFVLFFWALIVGAANCLLLYQATEA
jgi:hypothetical protein